MLDELRDGVERAIEALGRIPLVAMADLADIETGNDSSADELGLVEFRFCAGRDLRGPVILISRKRVLLEWRLPSTGFLTRFHASIAFVWDRIRSIRKLIAFRSALNERVVTGFE